MSAHPEILPATLSACHECDLLNHVPALVPGDSARCTRCGHLLYRNRPNTIEFTLALSVAAALLFVVANLYPFLAFKTMGSEVRMTLASGIVDLHHEGKSQLAALVFLTTILAPGLRIAMLLYILVPLQFGWRPRRGLHVFRFGNLLGSWSMVEVFMIGILVALVKLAGMAEIVPGLALWAFATLIIVLAWANSSLEPHYVWDRLGESP